MHYLVGNGQNLYRRDGFLVRNGVYTTITLNPDSMAYYAVAGSYVQGAPTAGVTSDEGENRYIRTINSGKMLRRMYINHANQYQMWRGVNTGHEPEFVFYQGSYSTSLSDWYSPEAYLQIPAYHFTIPAEYQGYGIAECKLSFTHGGTILQHMSVETITAIGTYYPRFTSECTDTDLLVADSDWKRNWVQNIGLFRDITGHPYDAIPVASGDYSLDTSRAQGTLNRGEEYNGRKLWDGTLVDYQDGWIPVTDSPWNQQIDLNSGFASALGSLRSGWIIPRPNVSVSTLTNEDNQNDYPFYYASSNTDGWWMCCSYWGLRLTLKLYM